MRIIKYFEDRIAKTAPGIIYRNGKKETIAVTHLDIDIEKFRNSGLLESYRLSHNEQKHYFSVDGKISPWVPAQKFNAGLSKNEQLTFVAKDNWPKIQSLIMQPTRKTKPWNEKRIL